jgi:biopolymer transport protein ExbD
MINTCYVVTYHVMSGRARNICVHAGVSTSMAINAGNGQTMAAINMTPMIDVLLVMLIIFMAIAPLPPSGLEAAIPRNSSVPGRVPESPVILEIAGDGSYRLNSQALAQPALRDRLVAVFARRGERVLWVKAAPGLEFSSIASAIDTAKGANIERVAFMPR